MEKCPGDTQNGDHVDSLDGQGGDRPVIIEKMPR